MAVALPIFQAVGTWVDSNTTTIAPAWPATGTYMPGDLALLYVTNPNYGVALTTANGFTEVADSPQGTGVAGTATSVGLAVYSCRADAATMAANGGAMPSPVVTFPGGFHGGIIIVVRGATFVDPPYDITAGGVVSSASTAVSIPGDTTFYGNQLVIVCVANTTDVATPETSGWANADLSGLTEVVNVNSLVGTGGGLGIAVGGKTTPGAFAATTATLATASKQALHTISLRARSSPWFFAAGPKADWSAGHLEDNQEPSWPAGHLAGDVGIVGIESENDRKIFLSDPQGFQEIVNSPQGIGSGIPLTEQLTVFWGRATSSSMTTPTIDKSDDLGDPNQRHFVAQMYVFRGCATTGNPVNISAGDTQDVDTTAFTIPGATHTDINCLVVALCGQSYDNATNATSGWTNSNLTELAEIGNVVTSFGKGGGLGVACGRMSGVGAPYGSTTGSWQFTSVAQGQAQARISLALTPTSPAAETSWLLTDIARQKFLNGVYDFDSDSFKCALFLANSNLSAASTTYAALTNEHLNANGYTTGGVAVTMTLAGTTTVTIDFATDPAWTAATGPIQACYAVIYEVGFSVVCYSTLDAGHLDVRVTAGNILVVAGSTSGIITLS